MRGGCHWDGAVGIGGIRDVAGYGGGEGDCTISAGISGSSSSGSSRTAGISGQTDGSIRRTT